MPTETPGPPRGRSLPISLPRRAVGDLVHFARRVPSVPVQRIVDVSALAAAREAAPVRVGWSVLFLKAYALVAREFPVLRRCYVPYPWERLYEHPHSAASVAVERDYDGEPGVFFAHIDRPEGVPLPDLEAALRRFKTAPLAEAFGPSLTFFRLPRPLRRVAWWYLLYLRGSRRAVYLGTFGLSVYSALGADSLHPLSPLATTLNYGVIGPDGRVAVRVVYDHRVMDGAVVARALGRLEEVLNGEICQEVEALAGVASGRV